MKKMPKLLSGAMALALVACMGTTAFAAEITDLTSNKTETDDVTINAEFTEVGTVYSVNVEWTTMDFTWTEGATKAGWDKTNHVVTAAEGTWNNDGKGDVTVTNHSNANVYAKIDYVEGSQYNDDVKAKGVTVTTTQVESTELSKGTPSNTTAITEGGATAGQNQIKATVEVTGTPTADISNITAGTFTVTVGTSDLGA